MRIPTLVSLFCLSASLAAASARPGEVSGTVLGSQGQPISGAIVWIKPSVTTGLVEVRTDAQGRYRVTALPNVPYEVTAWTQLKYHGETFCLRLAAENESQYAAFAGRDGAVRNFRLKLSGAIPDTQIANTYFGGEVRLMTSTWQGADETVPLGNSKVEVTLVPSGPLIDGSAGKTLVRTTRPGENMLYDIPLGQYSVTAVELRQDGSRATVQISRDYALERGNKTTLAFKPNSMLCGAGPGATSFVGRSVLYVARPSR